MAALDFPNSPTVGQTYTGPNGAVYTWDGAAWKTSGVLSVGTAAGGDLSGSYPNPAISGAYPLSNSVIARVSRSTAQSIPSGTFTALIFDTVVSNQGTAGLMWSAGAPDRLICKQVGIYIFGGTAQFNSNTSGNRNIYLMVNGAQVAMDLRSPGTSFPAAAPVSAGALALNDYIQISVLQDSGAALTVNVPMYLWAVRIL